jgi:hypothetical protein
MDDNLTVPQPSSTPAWVATAVSVLFWTGTLVWSWTVEPSFGEIAPAVVLAWIAGLIAVGFGGGVVRRADQSNHYSGFGEFGGALIFLLIPPMTLVGVPWTLGAAYKLGVSGIIDGERVGDSFSHDFKRVPIGTAGRPVAAALTVVALGWAGVFAHFVYRMWNEIRLVDAMNQ